MKTFNGKQLLSFLEEHRFNTDIHFYMMGSDVMFIEEFTEWLLPEIPFDLEIFYPSIHDFHYGLMEVKPNAYAFTILEKHSVHDPFKWVKYMEDYIEETEQEIEEENQ